MAKGLNQVVLMGYSGKDTEFKVVGSQGLGKALLSIATAHSVKNNDGSWGEETEWTRVVLFGRQAEVARDYLRKGTQVLIVGRLHTNKWQDETSGQTRYITEVIANELFLIGGKSQDSSGGSSGGGEYRQQPSPPAPPPPQYAPPPPGVPMGMPMPQYTQAPGVPPPPSPKTDKFDDDIPF